MDNFVAFFCLEFPHLVLGEKTFTNTTPKSVSVIFLANGGTLLHTSNKEQLKVCCDLIAQGWFATTLCSSVCLSGGGGS